MRRRNSPRILNRSEKNKPKRLALLLKRHCLLFRFLNLQRAVRRLCLSYILNDKQDRRGGGQLNSVVREEVVCGLKSDDDGLGIDLSPPTADTDKMLPPVNDGSDLTL